ncbi:hypothetical protein [Vibrio sp. WXL210]|uniref:hypothetical protein n=1 Tax=Vibrio sp. WXL210 TaxID=3450709 RepID=UPI003EC6B3CD
MKNQLQRYYWLFFASLLTHPAYANISLGGSTTGVFGKMTKFMQDIVNFLGGAGTMFVVFLSFAGAIGLWVISPKSGGAAIAWAFRAGIGAIGLFGMATLLTWIKAF